MTNENPTPLHLNSKLDFTYERSPLLTDSNVLQIPRPGLFRASNSLVSPNHKTKPQRGGTVWTEIQGSSALFRGAERDFQGGQVDFWGEVWAGRGVFDLQLVHDGHFPGEIPYPPTPLVQNACTKAAFARTSYRMHLRVWYKIPGTDVAHDGTRWDS
eukprot:1450586-Rhodomonas_salina.2